MPLSFDAVGKVADGRLIYQVFMSAIKLTSAILLPNKPVGALYVLTC